MKTNKIFKLYLLSIATSGSLVFAIKMDLIANDRLMNVPNGVSRILVASAAAYAYPSVYIRKVTSR